ncbi:response regulator [Arenibaculum sp.]|jgi:two-component system chemotaxis response regulator CheY|uniref:response regulator n=1 Tax=Arenibaculum sp. TaxID=2865862 RepID=UPI002E0ECC59|nr:response regulator [Arenibaculum sp.]
MTPAAILVVDDSPTVVLSVSTMLHEAGFGVETAMNGQEALDRLQAGLRPSLILTDVNMPVMDGLALIREARRYGPTRFTPILVLTSETDREAEARAAGASGWLAKPLDRDALLTALGRLLPT